MQDWGNYVYQVVKRYRSDIKYWIVGHEPNAPAFFRGTPKDYAHLARNAYAAAKKADPTCKLLLTSAGSDTGFFDKVVEAGAAGCFDGLAVDPYQPMSYVVGGRDPSFLTLAPNLRKFLKACGQKPDMPLWIAGFGWAARESEEALQADVLVKAYVMALAQGFERAFWFELWGRSYGERHYGMLRTDFTVRPSFTAYRVMAGLLGDARYLGWLELPGKSYGFVFQGRSGAVIVAWSPPGGARVKFTSAVTITDLTGKRSLLGAGKEISLTTSPIFIESAPRALIRLARSHAKQPFPWGADYSKARAVWCRLGPANADFGLMEGPRHSDGKTVPGLVDGEEHRRTDIRRKVFYVYLDVDNSFMAFGDKEAEIKVVCRGATQAGAIRVRLMYESASGYRYLPGWTVPVGNRWFEHTWRVEDASFCDQWGWNLRLNAYRSKEDLCVRQVTVTKLTRPASSLPRPPARQTRARGGAQPQELVWCNCKKGATVTRSALVLCTVVAMLTLGCRKEGAVMTAFPRVQLVPTSEERISFQVDGREVFAYNFGGRLPRPCFFPLVGPSGRFVTRYNHPHDPISHSHHRAIWIAHHSVNGLDFWSDRGGTRIIIDLCISNDKT